MAPIDAVTGDVIPQATIIFILGDRISPESAGTGAPAFFSLFPGAIRTTRGKIRETLYRRYQPKDFFSRLPIAEM